MKQQATTCRDSQRKRSHIGTAIAILILLLLLPPAASAQGLAQDCATIKSVNPWAGDGDYIIAPAGNVFVVYCHNMATVPTEYLRLVNTGDGVNYSAFGGESSAPPANVVTTMYTKIRFDPSSFLVDIADQTFAVSSGIDCCIGPIPITSMPYATASDCLAPGSAQGKANVDLTGLPFIVDDTFTVAGFDPLGCANGSCGGEFASFPILAPVVDLTGGGFCGGIAPSAAGDDIFQPVQFDLQLRYVGGVVVDVNTCKKGGWRAFGVFKNQGDCVSFFASGGKKQPAR